MSRPPLPISEELLTVLARALGKRRMASMTPAQLRKHQQAAARARWGPKRKKTT